MRPSSHGGTRDLNQISLGKYTVYNNNVYVIQCITMYIVLSRKKFFTTCQQAL